MEARENVCIIDTSNEIAGDGAIPHACIGCARRMMVPSLDAQHAVMIEAIQNHTPHTLIIDEIGRMKEVNAARTTRQRGVRIVASAHGDIHSLLRNPELKGLLGGTETVTMGDEWAKQEGRGRKLKTQRAGEPCFDVILQLTGKTKDEVIVIEPVSMMVDELLENRSVTVQSRRRDPFTGQILVELLKI